MGFIKFGSYGPFVFNAALRPWGVGPFQGVGFGLGAQGSKAQRCMQCRQSGLREFFKPLINQRDISYTWSLNSTRKEDVDL